MKQIENRFTELLAEKRRRERRDWTYEDISAATGLSTGTLVRFAQQRHKMIDLAVLTTLIEFFNCSLGDLLVVSESQESPDVVAV